MNSATNLLTIKKKHKILNSIFELNKIHFTIQEDTDTNTNIKKTILTHT